MNYIEKVALFIGGFYDNHTRLVEEGVQKLIIAEDYDGNYYKKHPMDDKVAKQIQEYKTDPDLAHGLVFFPVEWSYEEAEEYFQLNYAD